MAAAYYFSKAQLLKSLILCGATHPDYEQVSVTGRVRLDRVGVRWIPFWDRFHFEYNFTADLYRGLQAAKGDKQRIERVYANSREKQRQGSAGFRNDMTLVGRDWGFELSDINANPMRWYHGDLDINTSSSAAQQTVDHANRRRPNIEYKESPLLNHGELQGEVFDKALDWLNETVKLHPANMSIGDWRYNARYRIWMKY